MDYILTFFGGMTIGGLITVVLMCCFILGGKESREEEKHLNGE